MTIRLTSRLYAVATSALLSMGGLTYCPALLPPMDDDAMVAAAPFAVFSAALAADAPPPPAPPPPPNEARPAAPAIDAANPAARVLRILERSAHDLKAFTASIFYETEDGFLGQKVIRKGRIVYTADPATKKKGIAILFDSIVEDGRLFPDNKKHYVIKDGWLVEIDHQNRQFIKRQLVRPDENFDPLKLGEGPIPLPIGQPADEVLARFDVSLLDLPETGPLRKLKGVVEVDGLLLVPKTGTQGAEEFRRIELFYDKKTHLPVGVNVIEENGDRKTARLGELERNPVLDKATLEQLSIERPAGDWDVDIRPLGR